ncbi:protein DMP3-like [Mercurialis annua]|uniref:protein DMP3-like n=1 Tax=Mercurialis annua TaxID=3986 RepID=UPI00215F592D|nr:protein DMP3-like [Mercurialis annua]
MASSGSRRRKRHHYTSRNTNVHRPSSTSQLRLLSQIIAQAEKAANLPYLTVFAFQILTPIITNNGSGLTDLSVHKITFADGVHAVLSVLVFIAVSLHDRNVLSCFYPLPKHLIGKVLEAIPFGIAVICILIYRVFPNRRQGVGYPSTLRLRN